MAEKGRPKLTINDLPEGWEERIINLSKEGASIVELAVELDISRTTFYKLSEEDEHFMNTVKRCKRFCEAWWIAQGRENLKDSKFNYTGWYMNMKNRFKWTDRVDNTSKGEKLEGNIPITQWIKDNKDE